jgi:hypothetical protein
VKITFHRFNIADTEDPDVMLAEPVWQWQQTDHGRWVMANAHNLTYHHQPDASYWGYDVVIRGDLADPRKITEYFLRWPDKR